MNSRMKLAIAFLAVLHAAVLLAGFIAPYEAAEQERSLPFAPPTRLHLVDAEGKWHARPFVYAWAASDSPDVQYREDTSARYPLKFLVRGTPYQMAGLFTSSLHLFGVDEPARVFLFGSDGYGRDQFSRLLYGGRVSLTAGLLAALFALGIGTVLGAAAGYCGGWLDQGLMRVAEVFLALPWLYLLFAVRAFLPLHVSAEGTFLLLVAVLGAVGWARPARLVRAIVLSAKERNFVLAARGFGASGLYIFRRHLLPQVLGVVLTQAALLIPQYLLAEVTLSFLGLGVGEPVPSWGNMLGALQQYHVLAAYWWMLVPAFALVPVCLAYHLLADEIQARLQPAPLG